MDLDDLDFLSDYLKNRDKIILSEGEHDGDDDTNQESLKRSTSRKSRGAITESKSAADDESNVCKSYILILVELFDMNLFFSFRKRPADVQRLEEKSNG